MNADQLLQHLDAQMEAAELQLIDLLRSKGATKDEIDARLAIQRQQAAKRYGAAVAWVVSRLNGKN